MTADAGFWPSHFVLRPFLVAFPAAGLTLGFIFLSIGNGRWSEWTFAASAAPVLSVLVLQIFTSPRRGDIGLDIVAALSMASALASGEELAAAIVALMYASGQYLESFAEHRARREMTVLLARVPRNAVRHRNGELRGH